MHAVGTVSDDKNSALNAFDRKKEIKHDRTVWKRSTNQKIDEYKRRRKRN